jgi:hypothetical protein
LQEHIIAEKQTSKQANNNNLLFMGQATASEA